MRFPVFNFAGATTANPGSTSSYTHTLPTCVSGQLIFLVICVRGVSVTPNTPSGFTALKSENNGGLYYKVATAADSGASLTITPSAGPNYMVSVAFTVTGAYGNPAASTVVSASSTTPNAGSCTVSGTNPAEYRWLTIYHVGSANESQTTPPTNYEEKVDFAGSGGTSGACIMINERTLSTTTNVEDPGTATTTPGAGQHRAYTVGFAGMPDPDVLLWSH